MTDDHLVNNAVEQYRRAVAITPTFGQRLAAIEWLTERDARDVLRNVAVLSPACLDAAVDDVATQHTRAAKTRARIAAGTVVGDDPDPDGPDIEPLPRPAQLGLYDPKPRKPAPPL